MGRIFLDHIGGTRLFSCANCDTILTNRAELISTRFTGATGRAFLFNKVSVCKTLFINMYTSYRDCRSNVCDILPMLFPSNKKEIEI